MSWFSSVLRRQPRIASVRGNAAALGDTLATIRQLSLSSEPQFTELAMSLNRVQSGALKVAGRVEADINSIRTALSGLDLSGNSGYAARSKHHLEVNLNEAQEMLNYLAGTQQELGRLAIKGQEIQKLGVSLEVCRSTFQVDCGRNPTHQLAFQGFTEDLHKLSGQLAELGETIENQSRASRQAAELELAHLRTTLSNLKNLCDQSVATASAALSSVGSTLSSATVAMDTVDQACRRLRSSAREAAYHMQFGDIVRQQLEHVCQGLEWGSDAGNESHWGNLFPLEAAQLDLVHTNVGNTNSELAGIIDRLHSHLDELATGLAISLPLEQLLENLGQMANVETAGSAIRDSAAAGFEKATAAATDLGQHLISVQQLNHRMHLQALNAIVKSETLGRDSAALGVLSSHVHSLFLESNRLVDETSEILGRIMNASSGTKVESEEGGASTLTDILRPLEDLNRQLQAASGLEAELGSLRTTAIAECEQRFAFLDRFSSQVFDCAASLLELSDVAAKAVPAWELDVLEPNYTMASERDVHASVRAQSIVTMQ